MLKLFPMIPVLLEQIHIFKADILTELTTNFTTVQFISGVFSRAFFKRGQEKTPQSLYWERLCFNWAAGLLLAHGHNGKFPLPCGHQEAQGQIYGLSLTPCGPFSMQLST